MKKNPRKQLMELLNGLNVPAMVEGESLLSMMDKKPAELREIGIMYSRLAHIGMEKVNKAWDDAHPEEKPEDGN